MIITFIGDTHGDWDSLVDLVESKKDTDLFIQVGDFGIFKEVLETLELPVEPNKFWVIPGNHEDYDYIDANADPYTPKKIGENSRFLFIPKGWTTEIEGVSFGFMGGAASIDKPRRLRYAHIRKSWWWQEEITEEHIEKFIEKMPVQVMVTHDAPGGLEHPYFDGLSFHHESHRQASLLSRLLHHCSPELWVHGHHHINHTTNLGKTKVKGIACSRSDIFSYTIRVKEGKIYYYE